MASFMIKDGTTKEILAGDFVECLGQEMPYDPEDGWEYEVLDTDEPGQMILCDLPGGESYVSASLVDYVWRKV